MNDMTRYPLLRSHFKQWEFDELKSKLSKEILEDWEKTANEFIGANFENFEELSVQGYGELCNFIMGYMTFEELLNMLDESEGL